jgi:hypothetical protein
MMSWDSGRSVRTATWELARNGREGASCWAVGSDRGNWFGGIGRIGGIGRNILEEAADLAREAGQ